MIDYVMSSDGTRIGFERVGDGLPIVIVHGGVNSAADWRKVAEKLAPRFECFVLDRRGRGHSGDGPSYSLERERDDVIAVLSKAGPSSTLFGHSFGAVCALEAAIEAPVAKLIVYEPPLLALEGLTVADRFQGLLDRGDPDQALSDFLIKQTGMPPAALAPLQASPAWGPMLELAWTFPREARALVEASGEPRRYAFLKTPTLIFVGESTEDHLKRASELLLSILPAARCVMLAGQGHAAHRTGAQLLADAIAAFVVP